MRHLPTIRLEGTKFHVDISLEQFREVDNPSNTISFDELIVADDFCILYYDVNTNAAYTGMILTSVTPKSVKMLFLPSIVELNSIHETIDIV